MNSPWPSSDLQLQNSGQGQPFSADITNFPLQDVGGEGFPDIHFGMLPSVTTGHNIGQVFGSDQPGENEATAVCSMNRILVQGSSSGQTQINNWKTDTPPAVAPQAGKKRNGRAAEYSKNYRETKKKLEEQMKLEIEKLREENEQLRKNSSQSNTKLDDLQARIRQGNERYIKLEEEYRRQQIQVDSLTKSLENMSYMQEENTRLKTENDRLTQQLNADTEGERLGKKWVKIPLENRYLKIKGNVLHLKRLDSP